MVELPTLEVFKRCVNVALEVMFSGGPGSAGGTVGLNELGGLFQPQ